MYRRSFKIYSLLFVILGAATTQVVAEEDERSNKYIEEIIVTAEKRSESVLDVPLTMTAFDDAMIETLGIVNENDLEMLVAGLQFGESTEGAGEGTVIRGIGSRLTAETHSDLAVATYIDGVYTRGTYGVAPSFFDLERVEVARGPQGTLHGRNSIAGSISYYFKKPTDTWDFKVLTEFTDQVTQRYNVAVGGPITDNLSFRISGGYYEGDGYIKNRGFGPDYAAPDELSYSPQLRFKSDRLDINFRYSHVEDRGTPRVQIQLENANPDAPCQNQITEVAPCQNPNPWLMDATVLNPAISADCPAHMPGFNCGDVKNEIKHSFNGENNSEADQYFLSVDFELTDTLSVRYNYGDLDVFTDVSRDRDQSNRVASAADPTLSSDIGVPFLDKGIRYLQPYTETSHELQLFSNFDGPFNFITGVFVYENETSKFQTDKIVSSPFRNVSTSYVQLIKKIVSI